MALEIVVLSLLMVLASTIEREICVSEGELSLECKTHLCSSVACIADNITDSTVIRFMSSKFLLTERLLIEDRTDIWLEGSSPVSKAKIICPERNTGFRNGIGFSNIQNLTITSLTVENCGLSWTGKRQYYFQSAIYIINSSDITVTDIHVLDSVGNGLAIINSNGAVLVEHSCFEGNGINKTSTNPFQVAGAGGLYIEFAYCPPSSAFECKTSQFPNITTFYNITYCRFLHNNVDYQEPEDAVDIVGTAPFGRGGGLGIFLADKATGYSITVYNCTFFNNSALRGGGMHVLFLNSAQNNELNVLHSCFEENRTPTRSGGGVDLGYIFHNNELPEGNHMIFKDTIFFNNSASFGGGVAIQSSPNIGSRVVENNFIFIECFWERNRAFFSAAIDISMHTHHTFPHGFLSNALFIDCNFKENVVNYGVTTWSNQSTMQYQVGRGVFLATAYTIQFEGSTNFSGNNGTALFMVTSTAIFAPNSVVTFENNSGMQGGAIALTGLSAINVQQNSTFDFIRNHASSKGAAIYHYSTDQHEFFAGSTNCFIRSLGKSAESIRFRFDNNRAEGSHGQDIRTTSLGQCKRMCKVESIDPSQIFKCIGKFSFSNKTLSTVTSGASFTKKEIGLPLRIFPGEEFLVPFDLRDDLKNVRGGVFYVTLKNINNSKVIIDPAYTLIAAGRVKVYGMPGERADLMMTKIGGRQVAFVFEVILKRCPPGFVIHNTNFPLCICATNTRKSYYGIAWCNSTSYYAYAKRGQWFGYDNNYDLLASHCPYWFCLNKDQRTGNPTIYRLITEASREKLDQAVCSSTRTGTLCGRCIVNHSVSYHSYEFLCITDDMCRLGWLLYITTELLPLTLLFLVVIFFNISFTTGMASGFIFFAQVIDSLVVNAHGIIWLNPAVHKLTQVYQFFYRSFNFDFFSNRVFAFCLIKGATALDVLAFKYVTILSAFIMIFAMVLFLNYCNAYFYHKYKCLIKHTLKNSIIHGLTTFLVMCYTQCIRVSFLLLTPTTIFSRGGKKVRHVVFRNGEIGYFSEAHLPYALPALVFLTITLIPPALLIIYPLHYRIIAAMKLDGKQWFSKVSKYISLEKMKPLLDSFQSCFKDNCRFFAGLYFFYRFLLLLTFACLAAESYTIFYTIVEVQLIIILALHAYVQPYQKKLHNRLDTLILTNLAIINAISLFNYSYIARTPAFSNDIDNIVDIFSTIQLVLILLPLCILGGYIAYYLIMKLRAQLKREQELKTDETEMDDLEMPARLIYSDEESDSEITTSNYRQYDNESLSD